MTLLGALLLAFGQGAVLIGVVGIGVFNGMLDLEVRKRAEGELVKHLRK